MLPTCTSLLRKCVGRVILMPSQDVGSWRFCLLPLSVVLFSGSWLAALAAFVLLFCLLAYSPPSLPPRHRDLRLEHRRYVLSRRHLPLCLLLRRVASSEPRHLLALKPLWQHVLVLGWVPLSRGSCCASPAGLGDVAYSYHASLRGR